MIPTRTTAVPVGSVRHKDMRNNVHAEEWHDFVAEDEMFPHC